MPPAQHHQQSPAFSAVPIDTYVAPLVLHLERLHPGRDEIWQELQAALAIGNLPNGSAKRARSPRGLQLERAWSIKNGVLWQKVTKHCEVSTSVGVWLQEVPDL